MNMLTPKRRLPISTLLRPADHNHSDREVVGGFKWSSQQPDEGGCDEEAEAAFGSIWAGSFAVTWPAPRSAT
jgi:hypothetical protein